MLPLSLHLGRLMSRTGQSFFPNVSVEVGVSVPGLAGPSEPGKPWGLASHSFGK